MADLYAPFVRAEQPILFMDPRSAELTKYAANAMLATRISFMNEIAALCDRLGADVDAVRRGMGSDKRIGHPFLYPGVGFGGSCFPKDVRALMTTARQLGLDFDLLRAVERVNERQKRLLVEKALRHFGGIAGRQDLRRLGAGLQAQDRRHARGPGADHHRGAAGGRGARVRAHDPVAREVAARLLGGAVELVEEPYAAAEGADALLLVTEWNEFRQPDWARLKALMRTPVLFDGRNVWDRAKARAAGFTYHGSRARRHALTGRPGPRLRAPGSVPRRPPAGEQQHHAGHLLEHQLEAAPHVGGLQHAVAGLRLADGRRGHQVGHGPRGRLVGPPPRRAGRRPTRAAGAWPARSRAAPAPRPRLESTSAPPAGRTSSTSSARNSRHGVAPVTSSSSRTRACAVEDHVDGAVVVALRGHHPAHPGHRVQAGPLGQRLGRVDQGGHRHHPVAVQQGRAQGAVARLEEVEGGRGAGQQHHARQREKLEGGARRSEHRPLGVRSVRPRAHVRRP